MISELSKLDPAQWWRPAALVLALALPGHIAMARDFTDATGRVVTIPDAPGRVFAAGPPASTLLYMLAQDRMILLGASVRSSSQYHR